MMNSLSVLRQVKQAEIQQIKEVISAFMTSGVRYKPLTRTLKKKEQLDRENEDTKDLETVTSLKHDSMIKDAAIMRYVYEAMRARRDINIGRASRSQRLVSGLTTLNKRELQLNFDLNRR